MRTGIWDCRNFKMQASKGFFFLALQCHPQQTISKFVRFPGLNPHCRNTFRFQHSILASTVTIIVNSVHITLFMTGRKKDHLQINQKKKKKKKKNEKWKSMFTGMFTVYLIVHWRKLFKSTWWLLNCKLPKHQHLTDVFWCSLLTCLTTGF